MPNDKPLYRAIAETLQWIDALVESGDKPKLFNVAEAKLAYLEKRLPSGSGIDAGTWIDRQRSSQRRIVLICSFHHMNENGYYDGWTDHTITIKPSLTDAFSLTIGGRNRNDIKDYLHDVYDHALRASVPEYTHPKD